MRYASVKSIAMVSLIVGLGVVLALPLAAQPEPPVALSESIDVRVVNVEVVVTDRQGVRVSGLHPNDFRLLVDGQPVPIEYFTEIRGGMAIATGAGVTSGIPTVVPGTPLPTSYLVFIDDFFTLPSDRQAVLEAMLDDLPNLGPEDKLAVVAWDGGRIDLLSSWSSSPRQLEAALREAMERPAYGLHRLAERRQLDVARRFTRRASLVESGRLDVEERFYADRLSDQLGSAVAASAAALRGFGRPLGRKVMLLVSGGWPWAPANFVDGTPLGAFYETSYGRGGERLYAPLVETANLLGYTLYPVDAPGLEETAGIDASRAFGERASFGDLNHYQEQEIHTTLLHLAGETGGRALINGGRGVALPEVAGDTRSFYWLGFTADRQGDDAAHRIEVELLKPGLKLRTRAGFTDLSKEREVAMAVESALLFGHPAGNGSLEMEIGAPRRAGHGKIEVPLTVHIPVDAISLVPAAADTYVANLALRVAVIDGRGGRSDIPSVPFVVTLAQAPEPGEQLEYVTTLKMRDRPHDMVVAVYDEASGALLSAAAELGR